MTLSKNNRIPYAVSIEAPSVLFWFKKSSIIAYLPSFVLVCSASTESAHLVSSKGKWIEILRRLRKRGSKTLFIINSINSMKKHNPEKLVRFWVWEISGKCVFELVNQWRWGMGQDDGSVGCGFKRFVVWFWNILIVICLMSFAVKKHQAVTYAWTLKSPSIFTVFHFCP